jgi:hypothetical protein
MKRFFVIAILSAAICGCGDNDGDDVAEAKTMVPIDQVPTVVWQAAIKEKPDLTFYTAAKDKYKGQDSFELKGRSKSGKITELEVSPEGKILGID